MVMNEKERRKGQDMGKLMVQELRVGWNKMLSRQTG
jgi:hypothetical protein